MKVNDIADEVYKLQKSRMGELGGELTPELVFMHLTEEVGEIARQMVNRNTTMREYDPANMAEEISQAFLDLLVMSKTVGMDMELEAEKKLKDIKKKAGRV